MRRSARERRVRIRVTERLGRFPFTARRRHRYALWARQARDGRQQTLEREFYRLYFGWLAISAARNRKIREQ